MSCRRESYRREFTPVPSYGSVFVYMIPTQNVMPARVIPARVHSGSLLWLCIRSHDTNTKCHAGASQTGASSPRFLCRNEIFIPARKFIPVSCKRDMTVRFISIKVSSILRHYKTRTPTNMALCKHGATFHLAPE